MIVRKCIKNLPHLIHKEKKKLFNKIKKINDQKDAIAISLKQVLTLT